MNRTDRPIEAVPPGVAPVSRRGRLGWGGFLFVFVTVLLAVGAINSQNNLLFWVFGVAVSAVIVSGLVSGNGMMGLRLVAHEVADTEVGQPGEVSYTLVSRNRLLPVFGITIEETGDVAGVRPACVMHIRPMGRERAVSVWTPARRGPHRFDRVVIESRFPFGFIVKSMEFSLPRRAIATPAVVEVDRSIVERAGAEQSEHRVRRARRGAGGSYFGVRAYAPGDPRRLVAWKPTARRGELMVIDHAEPSGRSLWVHVTRPSDPAARELACERAISLAVALVSAGQRAGRPVGVWAPWAGVRLTPSASAVNVRRVATAMAMVELDRIGVGDAPPPARPGEAVVAIELGRFGRADLVLDPDEPSGWLAPGATLPRVLGGPWGGDA